MRLLSFLYRGREGKRVGAIKGNDVVDLTDALVESSLRKLLENGRLTEAATAVDRATRLVPLTDIIFLPVVPDPQKILCVGVNYDDHRKETGRDKSEYPVIFTRFANVQVGHLEPIVRPLVSTQLDYEGELAVVIGKRGRHVPASRALDYVAGYACYNDASVRDWQRHTHQFTPGKNFVGTGGFGPYLVTSDEIPDPSRLTLSTRLNGEAVQHVTTDQLIFSVPDLIHYISTFTELVPGDVIATGTPGGVGSKRNPPLYMKAGDVVEVEISEIGILQIPFATKLAEQGRAKLAPSRVTRDGSSHLLARGGHFEANRRGGRER